MAERVNVRARVGGVEAPGVIGLAGDGYLYVFGGVHEYL